MGGKKKAEGPDASKLTEAALSEAALSYLNRYDATVEQLRRVLARRVKRYGTADDAEAVAARIEELLQRFVDSKLLDDSRFARGFTRAARERGNSAQRIKQKLRLRGLEPELIDQALGELNESDSLGDLSAARRYVQKRRLTTRFDLENPAEKQKALASLARQGFSFRTAQEALAAETQGEEF